MKVNMVQFKSNQSIYQFIAVYYMYIKVLFTELVRYIVVKVLMYKKQFDRDTMKAKGIAINTH